MLRVRVNLELFCISFISKLLIHWYEFKTSYWLNTQVDRWKVWINSMWKSVDARSTHDSTSNTIKPLLNGHDL
jgi:hypothetical protein